MKSALSALPTSAQPALQKRRFSTDEDDSDDESAIVRPEDLVRRWGGVHVRGDSLEPVTARPLEVDDMARRRRRRCGFACCTLVIAVVALLIAFPTVSRAARPLIQQYLTVLNRRSAAARTKVKTKDSAHSDGDGGVSRHCSWVAWSFFRVT